MFYIGSHKGTDDDGYVCSSTWMLEEYNQRPEDFIRKILFRGEHSDIRIIEAQILDTLNVRHDPRFYNQHNGNGDFYLKHQTEETRQKQSISKRGELNPNHPKNITAERLEKLRIAGYKVKGTKRSDDAKERYRLSKLGANNPNYGKAICTSNIPLICSGCDRTFYHKGPYTRHINSCLS